MIIYAREPAGSAGSSILSAARSTRERHCRPAPSRIRFTAFLCRLTGGAISGRASISACVR
jgi:hypothetical protein